MRVVHCHPTDAKGGGSKLTYRLHDGLQRRHGVDSTLAVGKKHRDDETVHELGSLPGERYLTYGIERALSLDGFGSPSSLRFQRLIDEDVDLVHLHNVHGYYFNLLNVRLLPDDLPVVWTFHDMWPVTGNCVHSYDCDRFQSACGNCPQLDSYPPLWLDTTRLLLAVKKRLLPHERLHVAVPSAWMERQTRASTIPYDPVTHVPNGIDTEQFRPVDSVAARDRFDIDNDRVVLFSAGNLTDPNKGLSDLLETLGSVGPDEVTLLALGRGSVPPESVPAGCTVRAPGFLSQSEMVLAYNAADVTVVPSYGESFCLTATESMACETPVVGYDVGGLGEQLTDRVGWVVDPGDVESFTAALNGALANAEQREARGRAARAHVTDSYRIETTVDRYFELYRRILDQ